MFFGDCTSIEMWKATRRRFLKTLALTGTLLSVGVSGPFKKMGFATEGTMTPEEMRQKAMQLFRKPMLFQ